MFNVLAMMIQAQVPDSRPLYTDNASILHHMSDALHQSLYRVLSLLIAVLPGILAFFVALAVFTVIGMLISAVLRRALGWIRFDDRLTQYRGAGDWAPTNSPTAIVARGSFWACVLLGLIIGVSAFDASYATAASLPISLVPYLTHAVGAILLLIAGTLVALPGAIGSHRRRECAIAVRTLPLPWRQMARPGPHHGHDPRTS
jgi:hypothetical protein